MVQVESTGSLRETGGQTRKAGRRAQNILTLTMAPTTTHNLSRTVKLRKMVTTPKFAVLVASALIIQVSCLMEWGGLRRPLADDGSRRKRLLDYNDNLHATQLVGRRTVGSLGTHFEDESCDDVNFRLLDDQAVTMQSSSERIFETQLANRVKMWPPWPLSLLGRKKKSSDDNDGVVTAATTYPSAAALFWAYFRQRTRIGVRQIQEVGSQLWFHLPPAAPPLILLASLPRKLITENKEAGVALSKRVVPLFANPFARNLALSGLGLAVMSWANMEVHRKRHLAPLPLALPYRSVSRVFLPPFLPSEVPEPEIEALQSAENPAEEQDESDDHDDNHVMSLVSPKIRKHLSDLYVSAPGPGFLKEWKRLRGARRREAAKIRRLRIFDELVAFQAIKRKSARGRKSDSVQEMDGPGYALVTGASQGIGRAIAVELARWEIPLVLVARDLDRLTSLAFDLEACYGVKCCVLKADLSEVDAAEKIHETTKKAGITVDILVNNAGVAYEGLSVDMDTTEVERMVIVNAMTYAKLGNLYGQNMKKRGRGRILMVSSMAGLTSSSPYTALYGATKAFGKSLALSMARELEPYGVGVTCIMPGAVTNTEFRNRSGTGRALCWYLPFYPRPAEVVAHIGVMSLLDGDTQVIPGWQNRVFVKLLLPILPQRVETMCVQAAWAPFHLRLPGFLRNGNDQSGEDPQNSSASTLQDDSASPSAGIHLDLKPRYSMQQPPRLLKLPQPQQLETLTVESATVEIGSEPDIAEKASEEPEMEEKNQASVNTPESTTESETGKPALQLIPHTKINEANEIEPEEAPRQPPCREDRSVCKGRKAEEESNDKACVGTKWRSQDKSQSWWFDQEDMSLSPRLGSIDILEPRKYALQRLKVAERPKWTIQT